MKRRLVIISITLATIIVSCGFVLKSIDDSPYAMGATPGQTFTELSRLTTANELEIYLKEQFVIGQSMVEDVTTFMVDKGNPPCYQYTDQSSPNDFDILTFAGHLRCDTTAPKERFVGRDFFNRWMIENLTSWTYDMTFDFSEGKLVGIRVSKGATGF